YRSGITAGIVVRTPIADAHRRIDHDRVRREAVRQAGGVDVRLERGSRLAQRVDRAVELAGAVVAPPDHRVHAAVEIGYDGRRLAGAVIVTVLPQRRFDLALGVALQARIERGAHYEEAFVHRFREGVDQLAHLVERPVEVIIRRVLLTAVDRRSRIAPGAVDLTLGHES